MIHMCTISKYHKWSKFTVDIFKKAQYLVHRWLLMIYFSLHYKGFSTFSLKYLLFSFYFFIIIILDKVLSAIFWEGNRNIKYNVKFFMQLISSPVCPLLDFRSVYFRYTHIKYKILKGTLYLFFKLLTNKFWI